MIDDVPLRLGVLVTLVSAALALGFAGLITLPLGLLTLGLILVVGLGLPRWIPELTRDSPQRTAVAVAVVGLLIVLTATSGPRALFSGERSSSLGAAVAELALPVGVPIGLLATLAAGALVAVSLELADRRGVQSALVLGAAVLGLASVAAPGPHLLAALVPGWPAAMFTLARLTTRGTIGAAPRSARGVEPASPPMMRRTPGTGADSHRAVFRWHVLPVLAVITAGLTGLTLAVLSGVATLGQRNGSFAAASGNDTGTGGRATSDYLGGDMDLSTRGPLRSDPLLEVPIDSPRLWRAGTLDQYNGRGWLATVPPGGLPIFLRGPAGSVQVQDPGPGPASADTRSDRVRPLRAGSTQVLAPGRILNLTSTRLSSGGQVLVWAGDRVALAGDSGGSSQYEVRSQTLPALDDPEAVARLSAASQTGVPPTVDEAQDPRWTVIPATVPERVRRLGRTLVAGAPSRLAAVQAVEAELAARMSYTLDSPVPAPGADAVDDVLFVSHSGFCEQFATAEVVLLRAAGVPSRMAVGFAGGEPGDGGFRTLRRSDAHAWVEVWFPGHGWVTSDPTPAAEVTGSWWEPIRDGARRLLGPAASPILVVMAVLLLVAAGLLGRRRSRMVPIGAGTTRELDHDLAAAFARLEADLRAKGRARAANETVAALARRLDPDLEEALQILERALYAAQPPSRSECRAAATALDRRAVAAGPSWTR